VDRKALPNPKDVTGCEGAMIAARNAQEELMASLWKQVLNTNVIGIQDDFFDLGGHSLLASQLISRIRDSFNVDIPFGTVFEHPTIESLTAAVLAALGASKSVAVQGIVIEIKNHKLLTFETNRKRRSNDKESRRV